MYILFSIVPFDYGAVLPVVVLGTGHSCMLYANETLCLGTVQERVFALALS